MVVLHHLDIPEALGPHDPQHVVRLTDAHFKIQTAAGSQGPVSYTHLENPETADKLEADIRRNFDKLMSNQSRIAAKAAGRAVDVSADDFEDAD